MSDARRADQFPLHMLYGENAPMRAIVALVVTGLVLAGFALWLSQDATLDTQNPVARAVTDSPAANGASTLAAQTGNITSMVQSQSAKAPTAVIDNRQVCPGMFTFYFSTRSIKPMIEDARAGLDDIVDWAKHHPTAKLYIEGHADVVGVDEYNVLLSYQRAKVIASLLESSGVAQQQVQISAMGSHGLISGIPGEAQGNRRVNVQINDPDNCRPKSD